MKKIICLTLVSALTLSIAACGSSASNVSSASVSAEASVVTETPVATEAPVVNEAPTATETPNATEAPAATDAPVATEELATEKAAESEVPVTKKTVTAYDGDESKKQDIDCLFRDDMPNVPYVEVEQYLELVFNDTDFVMTQNGDQFSFHGEIGDKTGSNLIIDTEKDTVSFDRPKSFLVGKQNDMDTDFIKTVPEKVEEEKELLYTLADYDIDLLAYDGKAYVPLSTISDINFQSYSWPDYVDGSIYLARLGTSDSSEFIAEKESEYFDNTERPADIAEFAYKELCFQIDNLYGKPGQARSKELVKRIESEGFDKALEEGGIVDDINLTDMKKYLKSTNIGEYGAGMLMLHALLVDGGHSKWGTPFLLQIVNDPELDQTEFAKEYKKLSEKDPTVAELIDVIKPLETELTFLQDDLIAFRDESFGKAEKSWLGDDGETECAWLYIFDNAAVFLFDHFDKQVIKSESGAHPFNEALAFAKEKGCENFVIDLSANTGGNDDVMGFILSSIENTNANSYHIDGKTRYQMKDTFYADKNLDGMIDEKDEDVTYDFNYAMMISRVSFSNGNSLPALASEAGIPMLGERSGGGGCSMSFFGLPGESNKYGISGTLMITYSDYESVDPGVPADYEMLEIKEDGTIGNAPLYDPKELVATVNQHFENKK